MEQIANNIQEGMRVDMKKIQTDMIEMGLEQWHNR